LSDLNNLSRTRNVAKEKKSFAYPPLFAPDGFIPENQGAGGKRESLILGYRQLYSTAHIHLQGTLMLETAVR